MWATLENFLMDNLYLLLGLFIGIVALVVMRKTLKIKP